MLFNSIEFAILLVVTFFSFYSISGFLKPTPSYAQVLLLILASFIFYTWQKPILIFLLFASTFTNAYLARKLILLNLNKKTQGRQGLLTNQKFILFLGVSLNLAILCFFKYSSFIANIFIADSDSYLLKFCSGIPLPIGISFYTFQGISLLVDLYRKRQAGLNSLYNENLLQKPFAFFSRIFLYISFFPQLIAGPIVKAHEFIDQIKSKRFAEINWRLAVENLIRGYFFKIVIADNLKEITVFISSPNYEQLRGGNLFLLVFAYSVQIFSDFAGYSYIAIGLGALFGFKLPVNFQFPYIATSFAEFWRRWHISLSTWLRDYLYFSLGGNRKGAWRTYANLFIVMFLGGLWHGASWNFAVWGIAHGLLLATERLLREKFMPKKSNMRFAKILSCLRAILVFTAVSFLWLLFIFPDFPETINYMKCMFKNGIQIKMRFFYTFIIFTSPVAMFYMWFLFKRKLSGKENLPANQLGRGFELIEIFAYAFALFMIFNNYGSQKEFIYFQF